jgi:DNA-binding FrmR family transcriptional regulator
MVLEPRLCVDILQQLAAAEAACNRIRPRCFDVSCGAMRTGVTRGEPERSRRLSELGDIFDRFAK